MDGQLLTIRAERSLTSGDGVKWITREREAVSFLRQLNLGQGIDTENIKANYSNGVLSVTIPVSEKAKPRKIEVASDQTSPAITAHENRDEPQPSSSDLTPCRATDPRAHVRIDSDSPEPLRFGAVAVSASCSFLSRCDRTVDNSSRDEEAHPRGDRGRHD